LLHVLGFHEVEEDVTGEAAQQTEEEVKRLSGKGQSVKEAAEE
jgi:hypothetical protein